MLAGFSGTAYSQDFIEKKITDENGKVSLVTFKDNAGLSSASSGKLFQDLLKLSPNQDFRLVKTSLDKISQFTDEKYQLYINGLKVEGGIYNLHYQNGALRSMNGKVFYGDTSKTPRISASEAFLKAVKSVNAKKYMWEDAAYTAENNYAKPAGELMYIPVDQGYGKHALMLVYKFDIYAAEPISRDYIYVDAVEGKIAAIDPIMKHAHENNKSQPAAITVEPYQSKSFVSPVLAAGTADTRYSGAQDIETTLNTTTNKYTLHDTTRGNGVRTYNLKKSSTLSTGVDFEDNDNNWTSAEFNNAAFDNAALDAHWGIEKTYDYFKNTFDRNSYDGEGTLLRSYVHYGNSYENAGWTGSEMIYGDGASQFRPLTSFDVSAHELGHGVCSSSAALLYQRESGAINEGLSDIWGAAVEYTYAPDKQTWLIGEDITIIAPQYLRSMSNPKSGLTPQPDTYRGINWYPATVEEGCVTPSNWTNDNCGVHYNSGVLNHWFYILSVGKTGTNDKGHSYSVTGISIEKAAKITYRLETAYLTPSSNYSNARNLGIQAAKDLFGADSPEAIATQDAFYAVGIGPKYLTTPDIIPPTAPANLVASNITGSQATLTWTASTDENDIEKYIIYKDGAEVGTVAGNAVTYTVTGLSTSTTYNFYVKAQDPYDNISDESNTVQVTTLNTPTYCASSGNSTSDEKIKRVQFGTIDNPSTGTAGYEDFSYLSTEVKKGQSYEITITPDWSGTIYSEGYAVYIDWNNDGDFSDSGETAFTKAASKTTPVTGTITVPTNYTYEGKVRMRVSMSFNAVPSACGTFSYGQVEDYSLDVVNATMATASAELLQTAIYPNPVKDFITIQSKINSEFTYKVYSVNGQIVLSGTSVDKRINAASLTKGNYVLEMKDKNGGIKSVKFIKE